MNTTLRYATGSRKADIPDIGEYGGAFRDEIAIVLFVRGCPVRQTEGNWAVPSEELLDKSVEVRKGVYVIKSRKAVWSDHGVEFLLRLLLHARIHRHQDDEGLRHSVGLVIPIDKKQDHTK